MPTWGSIYFQNASSFVMEQLIFFHDHTMMIMIMIMVMVGYVLMNSCFNKHYNKVMYEGQEMESVWTVFPIIFLLMIAFPSLRLLYLMEEMENPEMTVKVMGHQWYWSYEYSDIKALSFDSYMIPSMDNPMFRLLNVDNSLMVPYFTSVRMIISSSDVIHSWTIPSLGVSADAVPGRLNQLMYLFNRVGMYVGQCSEICGSNHSFMPILVLVVSRMDFLNWV